jgi:hypothetical protein
MNQLPSGRIDPNALKLLQLYPAANGPGFANNYFVNEASRMTITILMSAWIKISANTINCLVALAIAEEVQIFLGISPDWETIPASVKGSLVTAR